MKSIKEVKNEYAKTLNNGHGEKFKDWDQFSRSSYIDNEDIEGIARLYAQSKVQELKEQNAELARLLLKCQVLCETLKVNIVAKEIEELLTKYHHLNKM